MALETPKYEEPKVDETKKVVDSEQYTSEETVAELNNNPRLAKEEADKIIEGLPATIDQLSPEQQKQFVDYVEQNFNGMNLNFAPKSVESVPDMLPAHRKQQIDSYKAIREKFSSLPIDQQEALKRAEKEAISQMTEDSKEAIESNGESEPDTAPDQGSNGSNGNEGSSAPTTGGEGNTGSQGGGIEL